MRLKCNVKCQNSICAVCSAVFFGHVNYSGNFLAIQQESLTPSKSDQVTKNIELTALVESDTM